MDKMIYLDNAATTKVADSVVDAMLPYFKEYYGNASSIYQLGAKSKEALDESREYIAGTLGAKTNEIYFTAGGSESDNWAIKATADAYARKGKHIITSAIEHHAVLHTCEYLEKHGYEVTYVGVDENGVIKLDELKAAIRPDTILISVMFANNEIGTIQPIKEIGEIAKEHDILFHTDAVQAYAQVPINVDEMHIDMLSASGHKIHGPKGTGFLYISEKMKIVPIIYGGGQQKGMRSGTDNVPGIAGLGLASKMVYDHLEENVNHMYDLRVYFVGELEKMDQVVVHGPHGEAAAPQIVSAAFVGVRSEVLLHTLEERDIYVSAGSACSTHKRSGSPTLTAIGLPKNQMEATVRFSFCETTTKEELDYTLQVLNEVVPMLRRYARH